MSDDPQQTPPRTGRRSSFAGQTFADLFGGGRSSMSRSQGDNSPPPTQQMPGPISQAAAQAQKRRFSLTTLGLSGSPNQTSPFGSYRGRNDSIGSANSGSIDESAIAEDDAAATSPNNNSTPSTPFARRTSFGARALRDIRTNSFGGGGGGPGSPTQNGTRSPPIGSGKAATAQNGTISSRDAKGRGSSEGFNWSDNFRNRVERTTSVTGQSGLGAPSAGNAHGRSKSIAVTEPPPPPPAAMPKPKEQKRPDHFQERILKGDFYMD